jgi:hypothetical protein
MRKSHLTSLITLLRNLLCSQPSFVSFHSIYTVAVFFFVHSTCASLVSLKQNRKNALCLRHHMITSQKRKPNKPTKVHKTDILSSNDHMENHRKSCKLAHSFYLHHFIVCLITSAATGRFS